MKKLIQLAVIAALCLPAFGQGPNTVLIGTEGITVASVSSSTAVFFFGADTRWNTITAPKLPILINCSGGCPLLGGDPAPGVVKSLYAVQQATAYTVTLSSGAKKTVPALPAKIYEFTCTGTGTVTGTTFTSSNMACTGVPQ